MAALRALGDVLRPVWNAIGGIKGAAISLGLILGGKLVLALAVLGKALLTTPFGLFMVGIAGLVSAGIELAAGWNLVKNFFSELWDSIVAKFEWALGKITSVMDKVAEPVRWLNRLGEGLVSDETGPRIGRGIQPDNLRPQASSSQANVKLEIVNAPRGSRVTADPRNTANLDTTVGYQMATP